MPPRTLALFLRAFDDQYQQLLKKEFYARASLRGFSVAEHHAKNDVHVQRRQILERLCAPPARPETLPAAILVSPVHESLLQDVAHKAVKTGVGWVSLNRTPPYIVDLRREYAKVPVFCVDPDQREVGRVQGRQFRILLPSGGELLYVHGPSYASSARLRLAGVNEELAESPIRMQTAGGDWSEESGFEAVKGWLRAAPGRDWSTAVVGAQNDSMGFGAHRAIAEAAAAGRPDLMNVRVTGCDGLSNYGQRLVGQKALVATVVIPPTTGPAIDALAIALEAGRPPASDLSLPVTSHPALDELARSVRRPTQRS
jgi:ABC-type sugar transport system substrate-binding protein